MTSQPHMMAPLLVLDPRPIQPCPPPACTLAIGSPSWKASSCLWRPLHIPPSLRPTVEPPSLSLVHLSFLSVSCARHQAKHAAKTSAEATVVSLPTRRAQRDTEGNRLPGTTREKPAPGIPPRRSSPSQSSELPTQPPAHTGGTPKLTQVKNKRLSTLLGPSWTDLPGPLPHGTVF